MNRSGKNNSHWRHGFAPAGQKRHPFYKCWIGIRLRCLSKKEVSYPWYGGKGIKVCKRWRDFRNFHADMFPTWKRGLEIDRIDSNGNYEPGNCRWATHYQQSRNFSRNRWIEFNGEKLIVCDWSRKIGGARGLVGDRLRLGWSLERALTSPPKTKK